MSTTGLSTGVFGSDFGLVLTHCSFDVDDLPVLPDGYQPDCGCEGAVDDGPERFFRHCCVSGSTVSGVLQG